MSREHLSVRRVQPGHDRSYLTSEACFVEIARKVFAADRYRVIEQPDSLRAIFGTNGRTGRDMGIIPELAVVNLETTRQVFFEVKKQKELGNAEERAYKHHTVGFYHLVRARLRLPYHPFVTVFCESLAELPRYTEKARQLIEPANLILWRGYDPSILSSRLSWYRQHWLDPITVRQISPGCSRLVDLAG